jgi:hypothetical protein
MKHMKELKLTVVINKPVGAVFDFIINPKNTPKWIDFIVTEQTNEWPVKLGTVYRNQNKNGDWSEYEVTGFESGKSFLLSKKSDSLHVGYACKSIENNATELEYSLRKDTGELHPALTAEAIQAILEKLKETVENAA